MRAAITIATLWACGSVSLHAQAGGRPNSRPGFWIGFGPGAGYSAGLSCPCPTKDGSGRLSGYARLGGTLSRSVLLGFEAIGWRRSAIEEMGSATTQTHESISYGSVILLWYPSPTSPLYLKAGLGGMRYREEVGGGGDIEIRGLVLTATAPSASLGIGYEVRMGRKFSLVPYLNGLTSSAVQEHVNVQFYPTEDVSITLVQFGLGVTWR